MFGVTRLQVLVLALNPQAPRQQSLALAVVFHGNLWGGAQLPGEKRLSW
jgi:hypothetical protein